MSGPDSPARRKAIALARLALAADARGDTAASIAAWSGAAGSDPGWAAARTGLGQALLRAGRAGDARFELERAVALAPDDPGAALALAVARSMLGAHDQAIAAAKRAAALAPAHAAVQMGLGDVLRTAGRVEPARIAYRRAVELAPDDPDALNKLGAAERNAWRLDEAIALLDRALARSPRHSQARVNRATLDVLRGRDDEARTALAGALADASLTPDARAEASAILGRLDEESALAPALAASIAHGDPSRLERALRAGPVPAARDAALLDELTLLSERAAAGPGAPEAFERCDALPVDWPAIEAHFSVHADVSAAALAGSVALVGGGAGGSELAPADEDVLRYARAVTARGDGVPLGGDGIAGEAWLRCAHAALCGHRKTFGAGRIKAIDNFVVVSMRPTRTPPAAVAATLRVALGELAPRVPAGGPRAAFLLYTIAHVHAFQDGNGRLARLVVGAELARVGRWPAILPRRRQKAEEAGVFDEAIRQADLAPIVDWLAGQSRLAAAVARGASAEG